MTKPRLNVLVAYPYVTPDHLRIFGELGDECRWLLDSGAFTAWKAGKPVSLMAYTGFLQGLPVKPWRYFALDVIGEAERTRQNYDAMLRAGLNPIPVFTRGEQLEELDRLFETSDCVGLGGVAGADKASYAWVRRAAQHAAGRKVHILGFTSMDWVKFIRPYSCDSSSWEQAARFGAIPVYLGRGQWAKIERSDGPPAPGIAAAIRRLGFDPAALATEGGWRGSHSSARWIAAASWLACSVDAERHLGTRLFVALTGAAALELMRAAFLSVTGRADGEALRRAAQAASAQRTAA